MTPTDPVKPGNDDPLKPDDSVVRGEEVLDRAREVARRITERVKKATSDTESDVNLGPTDDTAKAPPLPPSTDAE